MRPYALGLAILVANLAASPAHAGETPAHDSAPQRSAPRHPEAPPVAPAGAPAEAPTDANSEAAAAPALVGEAGEGLAGPGADAADPAALEALSANFALRDARNAEMEARRLTGEEEVARLAADLAKGLSPQEELEIQRRIARAKEDAELDLFGIQAKYARLAGFEANAVEIEAMVQARRDARDGLTRSAAAGPQAAPAPGALAAARQKRGQ